MLLLPLIAGVVLFVAAIAAVAVKNLPVARVRAPLPKRTKLRKYHI